MRRLEQGFTLAVRPRGEGALAVELAVRGATASPTESGVEFATSIGRKLSYAKLAVSDARGRALAARFEVVSPTSLRLAVDDRGAAYPVIIDPLLTGSPDAALEGVGSVVSGAGDVNGDGYADVVVGAYGHPAMFGTQPVAAGGVFLWYGGASSGNNPSGLGPWGTPANVDWYDLGNQRYMQLGFSVASAGDTNGDGRSEISRIVESAGEGVDETAGEAVERLRDLASEAPVIRLVNLLLARAVEARASDIHLEPLEEGLRVRRRIDGVLQEVEGPPPRLRAAVISRVKLMAGLDIAERRLAQDGRLRFTVRGKEIDFRVSTTPTIHGESLVLRILDRGELPLDFAALGFDAPLLEAWRPVLERPHGRGRGQASISGRCLSP